MSHEEIARRYPRIMESTARFNAPAVRDALLKRGGPDETGFVRFAYRPFDTRWLYWEKDTKLLDEKRADYRPHVIEGNIWLVLQNKARPDLSPPLVIRNFGDLNQMNSGVYCIPELLRERGLGAQDDRLQFRENLSDAARLYLEAIRADAMDLVHHVIAVTHDPEYHRLNADALRAEGPRIPLPGWPDGDVEGAARALGESTAHGRSIAALLDSETAVPGVTQAPLRPEIAAIAVPTHRAVRNMIGDDFAVTAGWGYSGRGDAVMPGRGRIVERAHIPRESKAMGHALTVLGGTTFDVYLNGEAFWRNVPAGVWHYRLGGYQVLKKWLSYRERKVLGRNLRGEEVKHFSEIARRIAAVLTMPHTAV